MTGPDSVAREICWRAWPLARRPAAGAFALLASALCVGVVARVSVDRLLTVLSAVVLFASFAPFFFPTRYRLDGKGVEIARPWRTWSRPWSDFRRVRIDRRVLLLSPYHRDTWRDSFRGETLLLEDNGEEVKRFAEE
ncbi:MAG: hypothetical protein QGH59_09030, partial [Gemmatimonadota bacterium]|nr:hypothetical protein [Gemmatimonadota bacterium]